MCRVRDVHKEREGEGELKRENSNSKLYFPVIHGSLGSFRERERGWGGGGGGVPETVYTAAA